MPFLNRVLGLPFSEGGLSSWYKTRLPPPTHKTANTTGLLVRQGGEAVTSAVGWEPGSVSGLERNPLGTEPGLCRPKCGQVRIPTVPLAAWSCRRHLSLGLVFSLGKPRPLWRPHRNGVHWVTCARVRSQQGLHVCQSQVWLGSCGFPHMCVSFTQTADRTTANPATAEWRPGLEVPCPPMPPTPSWGPRNKGRLFHLVRESGGLGWGAVAVAQMQPGPPGGTGKAEGSSPLPQASPCPPLASLFLSLVAVDPKEEGLEAQISRLAELIGRLESKVSPPSHHPSPLPPRECRVGPGVRTEARDLGEDIHQGARRNGEQD